MIELTRKQSENRRSEKKITFTNIQSTQRENMSPTKRSSLRMISSNMFEENQENTSPMKRKKSTMSKSVRLISTNLQAESSNLS